MSDYIKIAEGTTIRSTKNVRYVVEKYLGHGGAGTVYLVRCFETGEHYALKIGRNYGDPRRDQISNEINVYGYIKSKVSDDDLQYFGQIVDHFSDSNFFYIILELYLNDLYYYFIQRKYQGFSFRDIQKILRDLASGIRIMHKINIVHTDLKPENMMVTKEGRIRIVDFGSATLVQDNFVGRFQTLNYRSPESILKLKMGHGIDIWSFGCIAFELLFGKPLFYGSDELNMLQLMQLRIGKFPISIIRNSPVMNDFFDNDNVKNVDTFVERLDNFYCRRNLENLMYSVRTRDGEALNLLYDLVKNCLHFNPEKRLQAKDIVNHHFLMHEFA